jgi:metal-sulfur cluster biosynthetic enzyme
MAESPVLDKHQMIMDALRIVVDPEIGMDVVALGLVRHLDLSDERLHMTVIMTTPFCPYAPQLMEQMRRTAQEAAGVPTTIEMGTEVWSPDLMEDGAAAEWGLF